MKRLSYKVVFYVHSKLILSSISRRLLSFVRQARKHMAQERLSSFKMEYNFSCGRNESFINKLR